MNRRMIMRSLRVSAFAIGTHLVFTCTAQVSFGGHPLGPVAGRRLPAAPVVEFQTPDVPALMLEDAERAASGIKGPRRFGVVHSTTLSSDAQGLWSELPNGVRIWRLSVHCASALGIGITFSDYVVPEGGKVFLYNEDGTVLGGYTAASASGRTKLGVQPLPGERLTIEYTEPPGTAGGMHLIIGEVIHVYRAPWKGFDRDLGDSGPCNINTICPEGDEWRKEIRSVALVLAGGGSCSGQLLNDCNNDSIPYFLTANHCLEGGSDPATWVFRFNWESPTCDPTANGPTDHTVSGSTQLYANPGSDMLFLQLNSQPPPEFDTYYNGWDKSGAVPQQTTCIHHPSGDIKKITHDLDPSVSQNAVDVGNGPADCWHVLNYESGTTEPGSSGSGLWDQNHHIVGQLYGGAASCANNVDDYYGRFAVSYPFIEQWLGSCGDTLSGLDPGYTEPGIQFDAAVTSIFGIPASLCGDTAVTPHITLKNNGSVVLGSALLGCTITGGASTSSQWTGALLPGQTVNVQLPPIAVSNGPQELIISSSIPNGEVDQVLSNDSDTLHFVVNTPAEPVTLALTPDNYGIDITWELSNDQGTVLYSGGPYTSGDTNTIHREFCLGDGCYTFSISDEFGDGICCAEGNGHYRISSPAFNTLVESNGDYGAGETQEFCMLNIGVAETSATSPLFHPNPTNGPAWITLPIVPRTSAAWDIRDMAGRIVLSGTWPAGIHRAMIDMSSLSSGNYLIRGSLDGTPFVDRMVKH